MRFRDDERMAEINRVNVKKGDIFIVFVNPLGGSLQFDNFTEHAIIHIWSNQSLFLDHWGKSLFRRAVSDHTLLSYDKKAERVRPITPCTHERRRSESSLIYNHPFRHTGYRFA